MSVPSSVERPNGPNMPFVGLLGLAVILIIADQALKGWAIANLQEQSGVVPFIPGLLGWYLTFNTGAAWSMFSGATKLLAVVRILVSLGILTYLWRKPQRALLSVPLTFIAAGALGNAIDGMRMGKVTDMLYSPLLSQVTQAMGKGDFPIFNLADSCVVGGTLALVVVSFLHKEPTP